MIRADFACFPDQADQNEKDPRNIDFFGYVPLLDIEGTGSGLRFVSAADPALAHIPADLHVALEDRGV